MKHSLPYSLTIEGKREILKEKQTQIGDKALTQWLNSKNIPSIRYAYEHVRQYKSRFFRELFELF